MDAPLTIEVFPSRGGLRPLVRHREPLRVGIPLAKGVCAEPERLGLFDSANRPVVAQIRVLDRWSDGSVRWALADFQADHDGGSEPHRYSVHTGAQPSTTTAPIAAEATSRVRIDPEGSGLIVDTGAARFRLSPHGHFPFDEVLVSGRPALDPAGSGLRVLDDRDRPCRVDVLSIDVEELGPIRSVVRVEGSIDREGACFLQLIARLHFVSGSATVQCFATLRNPHRARHEAGFWELGDEGSVYVKDASLALALPAGAGASEARCSLGDESPAEAYATPLELHQESSGGANWASSNHVNRHGVVPLAFCGYRLHAPNVDAHGHRATPLVSIARGGGHLAVAMPQFWQNFPKAIEATDETIVLGLFPRQHGDLHELQGGEQKTHAFFMAFDRDRVTDGSLDWTRAPLLARLTPDGYARSEAISYLTPSRDDGNAEYRRLVEEAIDGESSFERKREAVDEYGWRHFGELYADHETAFHHGPQPLVSHYNNQYDAIAGFTCQFMRSGDGRWWQYLSDLAAHVADIDVYHTDEDKAAYSHGLFWHTVHYVDAGRATHRSYPHTTGVAGGGPSCEHNYSTGLMLHYFLTGTAISREAALDLARWVVAMDDGGRTIFRYLARGSTGLATATYSPTYHGPGRGAANSINALLDGHRLTGDATFLTHAESLIRRCIHPDDDVSARQLLDAERRWSYTVFLYVLGRYLDYKAERGEHDEMYVYVRESLLAYARWMALHETPYLDRAEELEFPNETWAAQDMRKSDVFTLAAKHADLTERARLFERAEFFFRYSTRTLAAMPGHGRTRPLVLLLSHGHMHAWFQGRLDAMAPALALPRPKIGPPERFVPQKEQAKRRLVTVALTVAAVALVAGLYLLVIR